MTKEELQVKISTIESMISDSNIEISKYAGQLADLKRQYADLSKPKLTPQQHDKLYLLIEDAVGGFDFDDTDNYSIDFGLDYDNRIICENFSFDNSDEVVRSIMDNIEEYFLCIGEDTNEENQD